MKRKTAAKRPKKKAVKVSAINRTPKKKIMVFYFKWRVEPQYANIDEVMEKMTEYGHPIILDVDTEDGEL